MNRNRTLLWIAMGIAPAASLGQVPDLVAAFDAGGRAMGMGGVTSVTGSDTLSGYYNPAGLGYISQATISASFRNFPGSNTVVTGDIGPTGTQRLSSSSDNGPTGLGHAGLALPLAGRNGGNNGVVSLSLTAGGQMRDLRTAGTGLVEGGLGAGAYRQFIKADTDFVNLSYGRTNGDSSFAWGLGLVYATSRQVNNRIAPSGTTAFDTQATGFGAQIGMMMTPKENPDMTFGLSYRTPIKLHTGGVSPLIYPEIPGRLAGGIALRRDGFRSGGRDWMVWGVEGQYFFAGKDSQFVDRNAQMVLGLGVEYSYSLGSARIPIRLGYAFVPAGGDFFGQRNALTFGLGYRPSKADWGVDLNFGRPSNGGADTSVAVTYKIGK